jgi:hypothetical protein
MSQSIRKVSHLTISPDLKSGETNHIITSLETFEDKNLETKLLYNNTIQKTQYIFWGW